jgi:hypothetical protein
VTGFSTEGSCSSGKILPSFRSGAFGGYKPNGSRMGRSLSAAIDDFTAGFAREDAPLRGEKAEPVAMIAARVKREYFILIIVVSWVLYEVVICETECSKASKSDKLMSQ